VLKIVFYSLSHVRLLLSFICPIEGGIDGFKEKTEKVKNIVQASLEKKK
jgi:hypothetical protein